MLVQQYHLHSPAYKVAHHPKQHLISIRRIPSSLNCDTKWCAGMTRKLSLQCNATVQASPADRNGAAAPQIPSDWQEPLEPMLWHVSKRTTVCRHFCFYVALWCTHRHCLCCCLCYAQKPMTRSVFMQGSEHEARKRVPADMAPPWKVGHCTHAKHSIIMCELSMTSKTICVA